MRTFAALLFVLSMSSAALLSAQQPATGSSATPAPRPRRVQPAAPRPGVTTAPRPARTADGTPRPAPADVTPRGAAERAPLGPSELILLPIGDSVLVYVDSTPRAGEGWRLWRDETLITETPAVPLDDPSALAGALGADWPVAQQTLEVEAPVTVLRRLRNNGIAATILVARSPAAARAAGRMIVDARAPAGQTVRYRAELVSLLNDGPPRRTLRGQVVVAPPAFPPITGLTARQERDAVALRWAFPITTATAAVVGFVVERQAGDGAWDVATPQVLLRMADGTMLWRDDEAPVGVPLQYRVRTVDLADRAGPPSAAVAVRLTDRRGPLAPTEATTEALEGAIRVIWRQSLEPDIAGYVVERARGSDTVFTRITKTPVKEATFTDSTVRGLQPHAYRIRAVDAAGNMGQPGTTVVGTAADHTPPAPASGLAAVVRPGRRLALNWTPSPSRDVLGYWILRADAGGVPTRMLRDPVVGRASADSMLSVGLVPGRSYELRVVAIDSALNESPPASVTLVVPDDKAPDAIRTLIAKNDRGRAVLLSWTSSPTTDVARYDILRAGPDTVFRALGAVRPSDYLEFRDTSGVLGTKYRYRVIPVDSAGNRGKAVGDTVTLREVDGPAAVRRLVALRRGATTVLEWERSASRDVAGYLVFRSARPLGPRTRVTDRPVDATTWTDAAAPADAFYVVRVIDRAGNLSSESAPAQAVTP